MQQFDLFMCSTTNTNDTFPLRIIHRVKIRRNYVLNNNPNVCRALLRRGLDGYGEKTCSASFFCVPAKSYTSSMYAKPGTASYFDGTIHASSKT